ncbi:MAG: hypothetical protein WCY65_02470 [Candidatus Methanomethylophilaceae archaeon]
MGMERLPATGPDVFGHFLNLIADNTVRTVVRFRKRMQRSHLVLVLESLLKEEPILSCRLVQVGDWMYWEPQEGIDPEDYVHEFWSQDEDSFPYCHSPVPDHSAPQIRITLIHGPEMDHMILSCNHSVLDGKGMKELTRITLERCAGRKADCFPSHIPNRSEMPIWDAIPDDWMLGHEEDWPYCRWPSLYSRMGRVDGQIIMREVSVDKMLDIRKSLPFRATIHDLLIASFYMALLEMRGGEEGGVVSSTVDDRRYMNPPFPSLANISSNYGLELPYAATFLEALKEVSKGHARMKEDYIGLPNLAEFSRIKTVTEMEDMVLSMRSGCGTDEAQYFISNLGPYDVDEETVRSLGIESLFGTYNGSEPPTIGITVSTFQGVMNMNAGYFAGIDKDRLQAFMDRMVRCLEQGE